MGGPTTSVDDFVKDVGNTFTQITQPLEKAVTAGVEDTSKNLTSALQPVEKAVNKVVAPVTKAATEFVQDPSKATTNVLQPVEKTVNYIGAHPEMQAALALAVAVPVVGEAIGAELMSAGIVTSAEAATAAATAAGATAAQAAAAGAAATATATTLGTAIASTAVQVAQGVPVEKAVTNTLVNVGVAQVSPAVAQEINNVIGHPAVADAITSAAASGVKTAAAGGSSEDITTAMTAGLAGSAANSAYSTAANDYNSTTGKVLGSATAGAVTGGTIGALNNALTTAASSLGSDAAKPTPKPADTAALPPSEVAALGGAVSPDTTSQSDVATGQASTELIPPKVAPLDITQDQSAAETARLADKNAQLAAIPTTPPPATADQKILDLIAEKPATAAEIPAASPMSQDPAQQAAAKADATAAPVTTEPKQGAYLPDTASATTEPKQGAFLPETAPAPAEIPAASPMSKDPAQKAAEAIDTSTVPAADKQILDLIAEAPDQSEAETARLAAKEAELAGAEKGAYLPDSGTDTKTTTYKPDLFTTTYLSPKTRTAAAPTSALGSALGTTGLTSYRGAGEIEGAGSGKPRKKVWNEESLKLKDALGV